MATNIYLYPGAANPNDVILRSGTVPVNPATAITRAGATIVFPRPVYYQASPYVPPQFAAADNTITPDNWLRPFDRLPQIGLALSVIAASGLVLVPMPPAAATVPPANWLRPFDVPPRRLLLLPPGGSPFVPKEAVLDNTVTPDNWLIRWDAPPRYKLTLPGGQPFVPKEATRENTTNTVWPLTQGERARPIVRAPLGGQPFVPREATLDNTTVRVWPLTQGENARPIARVAPQGGAPFIPREAVIDNTTNTVWPLVFGESARPITRVASQGAWVFGYPYTSQDNSGTVATWLRGFDRIKAIPRSAPVGGSPFVPREATVDNTLRGIGWWQPFRQVVPRPPAKTNVIYQVQPVAFVDNTGTVPTWLVRWQGPPSIPPSQSGLSVLPGHVSPVFAQSISAGIGLTVDLHVCGWGTTDELIDCTPAFDVDVFQVDAFQVCTDVAVTFSYAEQAQQGDPWSEQEERDDEYDEQDECGR